MKRVKAFTLAEVMIAITILGIIAVIVVPNLINNYKKRQTISRLKIAYSMLDNMTQQSYIENGYPPLTTGLSNDIFDGYFGKYLNIDKYCGRDGGIKATGCFKQGSFKRANSDTEYVKDDDGNEKQRDMFYILDGNAQATGGYDPGTWHKVVLKNGMGLATWHIGTVSSAGYIFLVDIDGPNKGQSKLGQDIFEFNYYSPLTGNSKCQNTMVIPGVSSPSYISANCSVTRNYLLSQCKENGTYQGQNWNGMGCSGLIIKDGWKISTDYPWNYAQKKK